MIAIIDYDAGNMKSVEKALAYLGADGRITADRNEILGAERIILPGVGNFADAMQNLKNRGLDGVIRDAVAREIPFLGICLGLQVLFEDSEESPGAEELGILQGHILRIPDQPGLKIPHIGWNSLELMNDGSLFKGIDPDPYVYFVHSYYLQAADPAIVTAVTEYSTRIHASVQSGYVYASQFHPEKSGAVGLRILKNFIKS